MEYFKHVFVIIFIFLLVIVVIFLLKKENLHFKLLKEMYPERLKRINSIFNPLSVFYILGFEINTILWFSIPVYFPNNKVKKSSDKKINIITEKLLRNNTIIFYSISLLIIWVFVGILLLL